MSKLTIIYNETADRRSQSLSFVGRERRQILSGLRAEKTEQQGNEAFLEAIENIDSLKRLA